MKRFFLIICALLTLPLQAVAIGLGDISVRSSLNQPLNAEIELLSVEEGELEDIKAALASSVIFDNAGVDRPFFLTKLKFQPVLDADGRATIKVSSDNAVREPFLHFIVQLTSRTGVVFREFALLLDPPDYPLSVVAEAPRVVPQQSQRPEIVPETAKTYGPVKSSETLWVIAEKTRPDAQVSVEQMMMAMLRVNPDAFIAGNVNRLRVGSMLDIPPRGEIDKVDAATARADFVKQTANWQLATQKTEPPTAKPQEDLKPSIGDRALAIQPQTMDVAQTSQPQSSGGRLRVVETGREWLLSHESHPGEDVYPVSVTEQIREEIADSEQDLAAVKDINNDLEELKTVLESRIETLRSALDEKDQAIAELREQLQSVEAGTAQDGRGIAQVSKDSAEQGAIDAPNMPGQSAVSDSAPASDESIWSDDRWFFGGAIILIGLLLMAFVFVRKREKEQTGSVDDILIPGTAYLEEEERPIKEGDLLQDIFEDDVTESVGNSHERTSSVSAEYHEPTADVAAVLTEADIYLAYRRYTQAENLIKEAMESNSDDPELMAKLLEVYAFKKDRQQYGHYLEEVRGELEATSADLWERVLDMTRDLIPDHPIFSEAIGLDSTQSHDEANLGSTLSIFGDDSHKGRDNLARDAFGDTEQPEPEKALSLDEIIPNDMDEEVSEVVAEIPEDKPFGFSIDDIPEEDLIETEILGLDIDLDPEKQNGQKKQS